MSTIVSDVRIEGPTWDQAKGVWRYSIISPFLRGANALEVLLPDGYDTQHEYRVLYVPPVETGFGDRYGDGLQAVRRTDAHNRYDLICVQMAFDTPPWYADHASDPAIRHESYLRRVVVPFVEVYYATSGTREGRLLLGFSKSGWGAFALILRAPDFYGYAASWDAPLMLDEWVPRWGMDAHFGTRENFEQYRPARLFTLQAQHFRSRQRLVLLGEQAFGDAPNGQFKPKGHTVRAHEEMERLGIQHYYDDSLRCEHHWDGGWVPSAIEALMTIIGHT